jgi:hypothetical protein
MSSRIPFLVQPFAIVFLAGAVFAQTPTATEASKLAYFEKHIRPALTQYCLECHSTKTEANGGLLLDSKNGWEKGGDSGEAIMPGQAELSRLLKAIRYDDPHLQMPPEKKLSTELVKVFEVWINDGAIDPRVQEPSELPEGDRSSVRDPRDHWAYQPLQNPTPPNDEMTTRSAIDGFIEERLQPTGIALAPRADRRMQIRRLAFDLTGLPPSMSELKEMVESSDFEDAYVQFVDRLLASPAYGEAFARRWMDVARYAESVTLRGLIFKEAWRYRDYLVRAYGEDRPFDQMVLEQIAGDLLKADEQEERWKQLTATTFLAMGNTNFEEQDKKQLDMDYVDEQLEVLGQAFLGQTIGCSRCHDHKFDPIPTKDYYALAGIFKSSVALRHSNVSNWIEQPLPLPPDQKERFDKIDEQLQGVKKDLAAKKKLATALAKKEEAAKKATATGAGASSGDSSTADSRTKEQNVSEDAKALAEEMKSLESRQKELQQQADIRPKFLTVVEESPPKDIPIHIRGDVHNLGPMVPRGFLTAIDVKDAMPIPEGSSGRLEFARWLSSPNNSLTARVYANRVWAWLMGQGLVESINNFGTTGSDPSHPELLDWLANELIRSGWSTKHLVRTIVLSDAYRRQPTTPEDNAFSVDPDNRLYWNGHHRRLTVEELRDSMLDASGELDRSLGGSLIKLEAKSDNLYVHQSIRRSLYQPVFRNSLPQLYDAFDFASPSLSTGQRSRSTIATQALGLLNDEWVHQRAMAMAARIRSEHGPLNTEAWILAAYLNCFQRNPTSGEFEICKRFFTGEGGVQLDEGLERLTHALLASIDFRYLH